MMNLGISRNVTAFGIRGIGTMVVDQSRFVAFLVEGVEKHDTSSDRAPGQHFVQLSPEAFSTVSTGVGRRTTSPDDYVLREYRGNVEPFLKREKAAEVESLACVVYTRDAYLADPDVKKDSAEMARIEGSRYSHIVVAVLASAGPSAPLSPYRLVHNLAGGNNEVKTWTMGDVRQKASESLEYWRTWAVVAD